MKQLVIIGASGHGKVVADIARLNGYDEIVFLDDNTAVKNCGKYEVVGTCDVIWEYDCDVFVAIGNSKIRQRIFDKISERHIIPILVHPHATVAEDVTIGLGTVVMAGAVINSGTTIGKGCIINTCSSVDHDCIVEDFVHVSVGAHVAGTVTIGSQTWIGAGAVVSNNVVICEECIVGAGAVVIRQISECGTYVGVPATLTAKHVGSVGPNS